MPNIKSAKKRLRQDAVRNERNRAARSFVRNRVKDLIRTLKEGPLDEQRLQVVEGQFRAVSRALDRAASKKIWHPNTTARKKSRLSSMIVKAKVADSQQN